MAVDLSNSSNLEQLALKGLYRAKQTVRWTCFYYVVHLRLLTLR